MNIKSAKFIKGIVKPDVSLENDLLQIAFIGRSNAGKSSVINSLAGDKKLARTSNSPGRTQQINLFLINDSFYLLDLPGYGYAKAPEKIKELLKNIIYGYLFESQYVQKKVVLIIDSRIGPTKLDLEMIDLLEQHKKNIVVVANKVDKIKSSVYQKRIKNIREKIGKHTLIPYSAEKKTGTEELWSEIS